MRRLALAVLYPLRAYCAIAYGDEDARVEADLRLAADIARLADPAALKDAA